MNAIILPKIKCGDANPNGNIYAFYKGGCEKEINKIESYRCTGCGGWFHKECILKHFKLEKKHDWGRIEEQNRIINMIDAKYIENASEELLYYEWNQLKKIIKSNE